MPFDIIVTLTAAFLFVALLSGWATSAALSAVAPERRRLRQLGVDAERTRCRRSGRAWLTLSIRGLERFPGVPKSPKEMNRLRRRLAMAGYQQPSAMVVYAAAQLITPVVLAVTVLFFVPGRNGLVDRRVCGGDWLPATRRLPRAT